MNKMLLQCFEEDIKQISSRSINQNIFFVIFASTAFQKTCKSWPNLLKFQSTFILNIRCNRQHEQAQRLNIKFKHKIGPLFWKFN